MSAPRPGILPWQELQRAAESGFIRAETCAIPAGSFQPASIDLRLGERAYRLRCSFLPGTAPVAERLEEFAMGEMDLREGAVLESGRPYLIPLIEELSLPRNLRGQTNPKSSTGRLDIFTRVITDAGTQFDEIAAGYKGRLYLEVFSRTFTIKVKTGRALNQLRLFASKSDCSDADLLALHRSRPIAYRGSRPISAETVGLSNGLLLGVDLAAGSAVGFRAKRNSHLLDLEATAAYEAEDYWEEVYSEAGNRLILEPEEFYLLLSKEAVSIPPSVAADMVAFDPTSGELRTHYAGFFDPGFGYGHEAALPGSRAVMEVRAHDVPFAVEDGQRVAKLTFSRMAAEPSVLYGSPSMGSHYQGQGELRILPKQFRPPRSRQFQPALRRARGGISA
ncbi:MAG: 2'-deoxycytidine 5'-triphosphate deaminase [Chloroflexi bacterium]|nr:2'-deoxycytidine 5'-triphosphate deaminase [Chloroflexota bacterium]